MAQVRNADQIEPHKGWPNGEQPSGWPGTNLALNIRDEYDRIEADKKKAR